MPSGIDNAGTGVIAGTIGLNRLAIGTGVDTIGNSPVLLVGNDLRINDTYTLSSANGLIQMNLGSGAYWQVTTDGGLFGQSFVELDATHAQIGSVDGSLTLFAAQATLNHSTAIKFDSPIYNFNQLTASTVPVLDASKNLVSSSVTSTQLGNLASGATGTFTTVDLKTVTVTGGIITSII